MQKYKQANSSMKFAVTETVREGAKERRGGEREQDRDSNQSDRNTDAVI